VGTAGDIHVDTTVGGVAIPAPGRMTSKISWDWETMKTVMLPFAGGSPTAGVNVRFHTCPRFHELAPPRPEEMLYGLANSGPVGWVDDLR